MGPKAPEFPTLVKQESENYGFRGVIAKSTKRAKAAGSRRASSDRSKL
jgi:hypothetical protein